jgi:outer membrane protein TolC
VVLTLLLSGCGGAGTYSSQPYPMPAFSQNTSVGPSSPVRRTTLNENSTLDDYLAYGLMSNLGLSASSERLQAATERVPQARSLPDPTFTYTYSADLDKYQAMQMFPWYGKRGLMGNMARADAEMQRYMYVSAQLKLAYEIKTAWYEYYYLGRSIAVTEENLALLKSLEAVVRSKYETGGAGNAALLMFQVEIARLEEEVRSLTDMRVTYVARLNAALGRASNSPVPWPKELPGTAVDIDEEAILESVVQTSPELASLDAAANMQRAALELAGKESRPDIALGVEYMDVKNPSMMGTEDSFTGMLSLNIPIHPSRYSAAKREAQARLAAAEADKADRANMLMADLKMAFFGVRDTNRKIDLYQNVLVPKARQTYEVAQSTYITGKDGYLDVIEAERMLLELRFDYERAQVDRAERMAEIEMLYGKPLPGAKTEDTE